MVSGLRAPTAASKRFQLLSTAFDETLVMTIFANCVFKLKQTTRSVLSRSLESEGLNNKGFGQYGETFHYKFV